MTWIMALIIIFFIFTFFLLILFYFINFLLFSHTFSLEKWLFSLSLSFIFFFFLATLLYIAETLWFLKIYFGFILWMLQKRREKKKAWFKAFPLFLLVYRTMGPWQCDSLCTCVSRVRCVLWVPFSYFYFRSRHQTLILYYVWLVTYRSNSF